MKIYVHIHNEGDFCHEAVETPVMTTFRPNIGDTFYLSDTDRTLLEIKATQHAREKKAKGYLSYYGKLEDGDSYCFDEYYFVYDCAFRADKEGEYYLHIELFNEERSR